MEDDVLFMVVVSSVSTVGISEVLYKSALYSIGCQISLEAYFDGVESADVVHHPFESCPPFAVAWAVNDEEWYRCHDSADIVGWVLGFRIQVNR